MRTAGRWSGLAATAAATASVSTAAAPAPSSAPGTPPPRSSPASTPDASYGPLYHEFKLTLTEGERTEAFSPFFYRESALENGYIRDTWAFPPFISHTAAPDVESTQTDILWKLLTYNTYGEEYRFQILQLFSFAGGGTQVDTNVHRFTVFPFYFRQRSDIPEKNYTALLPIYGTLRQRLARDEVRFAAFPLWIKTRKKDVVTDNYVYPIFHLRTGQNLSGWQVWPLVGHEVKDFATVTNVWGDPEPVAGHRKTFVLWPFFVNQTQGVGTTNEAHSQALIPFYSKLRSPLRDSTTFPWPIGYTHTVDREKKYEEWSVPWPFMVFARGEGKHVNRVWPFFSHGTNRNLTASWYAWPIYKYNRLQSAPLDRERTRILFFLYSDARTRDTATGRNKRRVDLWPLFTSSRELDGSRRLQIPAPLEPMLPSSPSLQRDLSPLWSLWRSERSPVTGRSSQSLLWNLWRRDTTADSRKGSLLFGMFQYESGPDGKRGRVFYVPVGKRRTTPPAPPAAVPAEAKTTATTTPTTITPAKPGSR